MAAAWLAAAGLALSGDCDPLACVLPSYMAGVVVVILMYFHGRLWRGGGVGFTAALLLGFNPHLLLRMQEVTPSTLALAGAMACLFCYGRRTQCVVETGDSGAAALWSAAGGLSLVADHDANLGFGPGAEVSLGWEAAAMRVFS